MGVVPWSPLAGGFLTGKYKREDTRNSGRLSGANPFGQSKSSDRNWEVLDTLQTIAEEVDRPLAQVALRWVMQRPGVASALVGARDATQLAVNIAATEFELNDEHLVRLNEASAPMPGFSAGLTAPMIRRMMFGGNEVKGWLE